MSNLSPADREYLENALRMDTGWVLHFTDKTFSELFAAFGIDINDEKYKKYGESKAKRMRAFWDIDKREVFAQVGDIENFGHFCLLLFVMPSCLLPFIANKL